MTCLDPILTQAVEVINFEQQRRLGSRIYMGVMHEMDTVPPTTPARGARGHLRRMRDGVTRGHPLSWKSRHRARAS